MITKKTKRRDPIARDLLTSGLYGMRVVKSKKSYQRKTKHKELYDADARHYTDNAHHAA